MGLAAPVENVMRGRQQPAGRQRSREEDGADDEADRVQGEPNVTLRHARSVMGENPIY